MKRKFYGSIFSLFLSLFFVSQIQKASAQNLIISGGNDFSMAVCDDGKIKTWGRVLQANGQKQSVTTPTDISMPSDLKFSQADAGSGYHVLALDCQQKVWAFGENNQGQLGIAPSNGSSSPVPVVGLGGTGQLSGVQYVSGSNEGSFAILADGKLVSWGEKGKGELGRIVTGNNDYIPNYVLKAPNTPLTDIYQVDAGDGTVYALDGSGFVWSWGDTTDGALGRPYTTAAASFTYAQQVRKSDGSFLNNIIMISGGDKHGLALDMDGTVWSWGGNWGPGQLGNGTDQGQVYAKQVVGVGGTDILKGATYIAAGQASSMIVLRDGRVVTFGANSLYISQNNKAPSGGNLGQGTTNKDFSSLSPNYVLDSTGAQLTNVLIVSDGDAVTFAVTRSGEVYVMGGNTYGELGLGNMNPQGRAKKLDLTVKYSCGLPDQCPDPNLGPDIPVCTLADLLSKNVTISVAGFRTYSYTWYYRSNSAASFMELTNVADTNTIKPDKLGQYMVKVERTSNNCTTCKPGYDTITVDQANSKASQFCQPNDPILKFEVNGKGDYAWYKSLTGSDRLLPNGNTMSINMNDLVPEVNGDDSTYSLYVEDMKVYKGTVGPGLTDNIGTANAAGQDAYRNRIIFNVYNTLTIDSVFLKLYNYRGAGTYTLNFQLLDPSGNQIGVYARPVTVTGGQPIQTPVAYPLGVTLQPGTGYTLRFTGSNAGTDIQMAFYDQSNLMYPITSQGDISGRIALTGVGGPAWINGSAFTGILNWKITSSGGGFPCGRLRVSLTRFCPCFPPKISLTSSTGALNFCDNGTTSSMVLTVTPDPATPPSEIYRYQWYKNDGIMNGSTQNKLTISSSDLGTYSVRVGHTSVLRTRCYDDTTFKVALQKPTGNNVIVGNDTICAGNVPKPKLGVGVVTGGTGAPTYQWISSLNGRAPWTNVTGKGDSVHYAPSNTSATTYFRRLVTNNGVCPMDTSNAVRTYVSPGSTPGTLIASAPVICENTNVTITTTPPTGGIPPYAYKWFTVVNNGTPNLIPNENKETLVKNVVQLSVGTRFIREVTSAAGGCPVSAFVDVAVDRKVTGNTLTSGTDQLKCEGSSTDAIIGSTPGDNGKAPAYQWSSSPNANGPFSEIQGATGKDLNPTVVTSTTYFRRIVTSSGVCKNDTSIDVARVVVDPTVTPGTIVPANPLVCSGSSPIINKGDAPTGGTPPFKYVWEYSLDGTIWNVISGYDQEGPLVVAPSISSNAQYRRTVQSTKCSATTTTSPITVIGNMSGGEVRSTKADLCPGELPGTIENVTVATGGTGSKIVYQWQISSDGGNTFTDLSGSSTDSTYVPTAPLTTSSIFRRRAVNGTGPCDTSYASTPLIVQYQVQNPGAIMNTDTTVCIGSNIKVFEKEPATFGSPTKTYSWMVSIEPFTSWQRLSTNERELNVTSIQQSTKFRRVVTDKCHPGDTSANIFTVNVLKKTIPDISFDKNFSSDIFCNNSSLTVTVSTQKAGLGRRIEWLYNGASRLPLPDSILVLNSNELVDGAKIQVVLTSDPTLFCTETTTRSTEFTVNIHSKIESNSITSNPQSICFSSNLDTIRANSSLGTLGNPAYKWQSSTDNTNWQDIVNSNTKNNYPTKALGNTFYRRITYSAGTCPNDTTGAYRIFMDSLVNSGKIQPLSAFQCQGDSVVINSTEIASGGTGKIHYSWEFSRDRQSWFPVPGAKDSVGLFIPDKYVLDNTEKIIKFYFKRTATSGAGLCFTPADTVGVTVCQDPYIPNQLYKSSVCAGDIISDSVIHRPGDYSPNGGVLVVAGVKSRKGASVSVTGNMYSYTPLSPTFVGKDTVEFIILDQFTQRIKIKYLYIQYFPVNHSPVIVRDLLPTYRNQTITNVNILSNDSDPDGDTLYVNLKQGVFTRLPKFGQVQIDSTGELTYVPERELGLHETIYDTAIFTVCDYSKKQYCNSFFCKTDTVIFEIKPYRIFVPEGFSPNDDGVNDYFVIRSEVPLDIEIQIYNRWGNLVYEDKHYKNDWNGRANRGLVIGEGVPDGTYYLHYNVHDKLMDPGFMYITISR